MKILWLGIMCVAWGGVLPAAPHKPVAQQAPSTTQMASFRGISQVAQQSCALPALSGWTIGGGAGGEVNLNPTFLAKLLASAGVKLKADVSAQKWGGILQKDAGPAFTASKDCTSKLFIAMVNVLPRVDDAGQLLPRPPHPELIYKTINQTTTTMAHTETNVGNTNGPGIQNNNAGPATNYNGPISLSGQQIVNYNNPPVTEVQKQQAHEALLAELKQLATYPEADPVDKGPSLVQTLFRFNSPRSLYVRLTKYYDDTISQEPRGDKLLAYKRLYYDFEQRAKQFDEEALPEIGASSKVSMTLAWRQYLIYCVERQSGHTAVELKANYGSDTSIDFSSAESVCIGLKTDPKLGPTFIWYTQSADLFTNSALQILSFFR